MENILEQIKRVITQTAEKRGIEIEKIILFGSRARGDCRRESDWDVLVVTKEKLKWRLRKDFLGELLRKLVKSKIRVEVLIIDKDTFEEYKKWEGFVYYHATAEGITV